MSNFVPLKRPYDHRVLIEAQIYTQRKDFNRLSPGSRFLERGPFLLAEGSKSQPVSVWCDQIESTVYALQLFPRPTHTVYSKR